MSLRLKFYFAFSLIAGLAIALGGYGIRSLVTADDTVIRLYDEPLIGVSYSRAAGATFSDARGLMDQQLSLGASLSPEAVESLGRMQGDITDDLRIVRERIHDPNVLGVLDQAEKSIATWFRSGRTILAPPAGGVTALPMRSSVKRKSAEASALLDDVVEQVTALGFAYRARAMAEMRASSVALASLTGGIFVSSGLFALLFAQSLLRPIRAATRIAEDVAADNLAEIIPTTRHDEIGRLLACLATMQANLRTRAALTLALLQEKDLSAEKLRQINLRFDTALENMSQGLTFFDGDQKLIVCNRRYGELFRLSADQTRAGTTLSDILAYRMARGSFPDMTLDDYLARRDALSERSEKYSITDEFRDGRVVMTHSQLLPSGAWVATHEDITERRRTEAHIVFLARHDALTQLPNRVLFRERLEQAVDMVGRGHECAILYLDLDHFKRINDTLGHPVGDGLLQVAAERLQSCVREIDTVARLGGDEFAIIQLGIKRPDNAERLANRIISAFRGAFDVAGHSIMVGISIGITVTPGDGSNPDKLLQNADLALYLAKQEGRGTARFFEPEMDARIQLRRVLEQDLQNAISRSEFEIHYQPLVNLTAGRITGFEALLRWHHPSRGLVSPAEFIPVAEETGMIVAIGEWVLRTACFEAENWPADINVAVNLSPVQFDKGDLVSAVMGALNASGLRPDRLELEITEMVKLQSTAGTLDALHKFRAMGIAVALDDFGTGYSSLSYLRSFPFDKIKIDQSFVRDMTANKESRSIIRAIISLGNSLRMKTTAEGVETLEQLETLREEGCTEIQGYFFSRPKPASALPSVIASLQQVGERAK